MTFKTEQVSRWTGSFRSSTRLLTKAGLGMSFVLVMLCPTHWIQDKKYHSSHTVDHAISSESSQTDLRCHQVEPLAITQTARGADKICCDCNSSLPSQLFPSKGGGRREPRCGECHNEKRRSKYKKKLDQSTVEVSLPNIFFNEKDESLTMLTDLITDAVLKKGGDRCLH